jgi:hypothetical protein
VAQSNPQNLGAWPGIDASDVETDAMTMASCRLQTDLQPFHPGFVRLLSAMILAVQTRGNA